MWYEHSAQRRNCDWASMDSGLAVRCRLVRSNIFICYFRSCEILNWSRWIVLMWYVACWLRRILLVVSEVFSSHGLHCTMHWRHRSSLNIFWEVLILKVSTAYLHSPRAWSTVKSGEIRTRYRWDSAHVVRCTLVTVSTLDSYWSGFQSWTSFYNAMAASQ